MKTFLYAAAITAVLASGCGSLRTPSQASDLPLRYHNARYHLTFFLPANWAGYSVVIQQWEGSRFVPAKDREEVTEHGPILILRHPQWKASAPRQDIPIRVFTRRQWEAYHEDGGFFIDAGGIDGEVGHNSKYVFSVWSRFNWGESPGWEEAGHIVERNQALSQPHLHPM
jgi:hypothetical protein